MNSHGDRTCARMWKWLVNASIGGSDPSVYASGGKFADATVSLAAGAPSWVKDVGVKNGEIVLTVKCKGFVVFVR